MAPMEGMRRAEMDLPTPGDFGLALGVAHAAELGDFRPHPEEAELARAMSAARRRDFLLGRLGRRLLRRGRGLTRPGT